MARFIIKLQNENYFLHEGPSGYAFGRSKSRAKSFPTQKSAVEFLKIVSGNVEVVEITDK